MKLSLLWLHDGEACIIRRHGLVWPLLCHDECFKEKNDAEWKKLWMFAKDVQMINLAWKHLWCRKYIYTSTYNIYTAPISVSTGTNEWYILLNAVIVLYWLVPWNGVLESVVLMGPLSGPPHSVGRKYILTGAKGNNNRLLTLVPPRGPWSGPLILSGGSRSTF